MISLTNERPTFLVNSDEKLYGTHSEFSIVLPLRPNNKFDSVALVSVGIPKSYYNVDTGLDQFTLTENTTDIAVITLPHGNYNLTNFQRIMELALTNASKTFDATNYWRYALTFDDSTYKWTYTITDNATRPFVDASFTFVGHETHEVLGFEEDTPNPFVAKVLTSTYANNFERTKYITVKSDIARNSGNIGTDSSIISYVPVTTVSFDQIIRHDLVELGDAAKELANNNSSTFSFSIHDDHNRLLELNGRSWFLTLFLYHHNPIDQEQLDELHYIQEQRQIQKEMAQEQEVLRDVGRIKQEEANPFEDSGVITAPQFSIDYY